MQECFKCRRQGIPFISRRKDVNGQDLAYLFVKHYDGHGSERRGMNCYIKKVADPSLSNNEIITRERAKLYTSIY